ncbi:MAG: LysR family transcriptional regulator [Alphaproteobacteria bacterium]|jgi:DNA-binding transcriptional LysR family regulator|nr:LysR family transcriptional regulator [Alphaproteobacteria bacterium]MDP6567307.1 LysR family transcriptional regulator [Alphaproteobacteria bacterium]MDP6811898.1 LysR family transcriptional regulator [Alphaproteobacteria bacterium]
MEHLGEMAVFAKVVEHRSFTAAAGSLGMSKSAVSKQVSRLEDRLGARLLNRTTRKLSLTEVGEAFYERCARIVEEAAAAEEEVGNLAAAPRGRLRVNASMTFGTMHLGPAIADFLDSYPEIEIDMVLDDRFTDLVEEGFDVAVRIASLTDSSLIARRIAPSRAVICAAPGYLERHGRPERPEDLRRHNCFGYLYRASGPEWTLEGPDGPMAVPVRGNLRANNGEVLREMAVAGAGIVASPSFIVGDALREGRLVELLTEYVPQTHAIYAVYPHRRHLMPKVRAFVDFLVERFGPEPYWDA